MKRELSSFDIYVIVSEMQDLKGSYIDKIYQLTRDELLVRINNKSGAVEVKEKTRISDKCSIGAYYFKSCELYKNLYNEFYKDNMNLVRGEKYIAPLYNLLIKTKGEVYITEIDNKKVHVLGTPEEVEIFRQK